MINCRDVHSCRFQIALGFKYQEDEIFPVKIKGKLHQDLGEVIIPIFLPCEVVVIELTYDICIKITLSDLTIN